MIVACEAEEMLLDGSGDVLGAGSMSSLVTNFSIDPFMTRNASYKQIIKIFLVTEIQKISHKVASKFYELIRSTQVPKLEGLKVCWDRDLAQEIPENDWKKLCASSESESEIL